MDSKVCNKCKEEKPLDCFYVRKESGNPIAQCKKCVNSRTAEYYSKNRDKALASNRAWRANNPERSRLIAKRDAVRNQAKKAERSREWRAENADRHHANCKRWAAKNAGKINAKNKARKSAVKQRTPSWANDQLIAAYYMEAKRLEELTGIKFHVDHIIPLQGELVSGLHVETNLQLLPAHENLGKSNSFDPELFVA